MSDHLAAANPALLDELMGRDPNDLADQDIDQLVAELRRAREGWEQGKQVRRAKAESGPKPAKPKAAAMSIDQLRAALRGQG